MDDGIRRPATRLWFRGTRTGADRRLLSVCLLACGQHRGVPDLRLVTFALRIALRWGDAPVAALLRQHGANATTQAPGADAGAPALLDEMAILAVQRGDLSAVRELLGAGARVDGNPDREENPLGQACWRGQVAIAEALLARGATTEFRDGGCAVGAALHGSRHWEDPEGGPTMATLTEIDPSRTANCADAAGGRSTSTGAGWWRTGSARRDAARRTRDGPRGPTRLPLTPSLDKAPSPALRRNQKPRPTRGRRTCRGCSKRLAGSN